MATSTPRLNLSEESGTDLKSGFPGRESGNLTILDNAALYLSGTLSAKPNASSTVSGTYYFATDTGALLLCIGGAWVWTNGNTELVGTIKHHSAATIPADPDGVQRWHIADGSAVSRSTYAAYFAQIGTSWGAGDGSTTFTIPDLRGKVLVGAGSGAGLTTRSIAQSGGTETVGLTGAQNGPHNHSGLSGTENQGHAHSIAEGSFAVPITYYSGGSFIGQLGGGGQPLGTDTITSPELESHTHNIASDGSGTPHPNLQPFGVTNHIVKIS